MPRRCVFPVRPTQARPPRQAGIVSYFRSPYRIIEYLVRALSHAHQLAAPHELRWRSARHEGRPPPRPDDREDSAPGHGNPRPSPYPEGARILQQTTPPENFSVFSGIPRNKAAGASQPAARGQPRNARRRQPPGFAGTMQVVGPPHKRSHEMKETPSNSLEDPPPRTSLPSKTAPLPKPGPHLPFGPLTASPFSAGVRRWLTPPLLRRRRGHDAPPRR